jgi:hypothetical protein
MVSKKVISVGLIGAALMVLGMTIIPIPEIATRWVANNFGTNDEVTILQITTTLGIGIVLFGSWAAKPTLHRFFGGVVFFLAFVVAILVITYLTVGWLLV